jgi:hypothetical protein
MLMSERMIRIIGTVAVGVVVLVTLAWLWLLLRLAAKVVAL